MRQKTLKRAAAAAKAKAPRITDTERATSEKLVAVAQMWVARLQCTAEAQQLAAANAALESFAKQLGAKYGVAPPFRIADDGTLTAT